MKEIMIKENEAGQRLNKYLHKYLKEASSSFLYKMLRKKNITLNGKRAEGNEILNKGDILKLFLSDETIEKFGFETECYKEYEKAYEQYKEIFVIYENKHVIIVNKPSGILTQKAVSEDLSLNEWLIGYMIKNKLINEEELKTFRPSVLNRLDRNTSGMVICGKTLLGSQKMSSLLKDRSLHKYYRLFVKGIVKKEVFLEGCLEKDEILNTVRITTSKTDGSYIATKYKPIKNYKDITLVEAQLITGKTHQIRLHLSSEGHPLVGDYKYGDRSFNDRYKKKYGIKSQLLHAYRLEFPALDGELNEMSRMILTAPLPEVFELINKNEE